MGRLPGQGKVLANTMTDCIVIGAGLIGMLTARELAAAGLSVCVLERGEAAREASWAGGGILSPLYPWRAPDAVSRLAAWSQGEYRRLAEELAAETGIDPQWTASGLLVCDPDQPPVIDPWARSFGAQVQWLEGGAVRECEPALIADQDHALWLPDVAQVRNPRLGRALRASLLGRGVDLREATPVRGLIAAGGRVTGAETGAGALFADVVVVAGGAWSAGLLAPLGVSLPVVPVRGQMVLFQARPETLRRIVLDGGRYVIPRRDGRVLAGSTLEYVGFDRSTTEAALAELRAAAVGLIPALERFSVAGHWSGLRPGSPDEVPYIGQVPDTKGLYVSAGHFRNGVVTAPASARLLADLILERPPILDPGPFNLDRVQIAKNDVK